MCYSISTCNGIKETRKMMLFTGKVLWKVKMIHTNTCIEHILLPTLIPSNILIIILYGVAYSGLCFQVPFCSPPMKKMAGSLIIYFGPWNSLFVKSSWNQIHPSILIGTGIVWWMNGI